LQCAPAKAILFQFLTEAVTISLMADLWNSFRLRYCQGTDSLVGLSTTITPASVLMAFGSHLLLELFLVIFRQGKQRG